MGGDEFTTAFEAHRHELFVHCYRMLGSVHDADDLLQDTMVRAWKAFDRFDPDRASLRTWLYRIATNVCLNALESRARRPLPSDVGARFDDPDAEFVPGFEVPWLQPVPADPAASAVERDRLRLAFVAALQVLTAKQRAVVLLCEVLDGPAAEVAELLDTTAASVNSALQRARGRLATHGIDPDSVTERPEQQRVVVDRYVAAFERGDVAGLAALLADDVVLEMPPMWNWYAGADDYAGFIRRVFRLRGTGWTTSPLWANGEAGFAAYVSGALHSVQILTVNGGLVTRATVFQLDEIFNLFSLRDESAGPHR